MAITTAAVMAGVRRRRLVDAKRSQQRQKNEQTDRFWLNLAEKVREKDLLKLVEKFDTDRSGNLNAEELRNLIEYHAAANGHRTPPTDAEVSWILQAAGKKTPDSVDASEIEFALDLWHSYVNNRARIEAVFDKYDTNQSRKLEIDKLKLYLTYLNRGQPPKDAEILQLMQAVNGVAGISRMQLMLVTSLWHIHMEEVGNKCCSVS